VQRGGGLMMCWLRARGLGVFWKHKQDVKGAAIQEYKKTGKTEREQKGGPKTKESK